jgi:hypothetical protein
MPQNKVRILPTNDSLTLLLAKNIDPRYAMQNYKNHVRYFPLHHFVITPLSLLLLSWSFWSLAESYADDGDLALPIYLLISAILIFLLPVNSRIYAIKNQNRIIRLEMRVRFFQLTGNSFSEWEERLTLSQIIALRFAGDDELISLLEKAVDQKLNAKAIKRNIKD